MSKQKRSFRRRIFDIIQIAGGSDRASLIFDRVLIFLILLSIVITTAETFRLPPAVYNTLEALDACCMVFFTVEYAVRVWTADLLYPHSKVPRLRFVSSPGAVIDLLSFLPFYLTGLIPAGMVVFRLVRVARILRIFRINRYSDPISAILDVFRRKASLIFASIFLVMVLMLGASLVMYYAEHEAQPSVFENAFSGLWWAVSTLSTTGYGDIYPVTLLGKTLAIVITLLGMSVVALPTGIITAGFMEAAGQEETLKIILPDGTEAVSGIAPAGAKPEKSGAKAGKNQKEKGNGKDRQKIQAEENPRFVLRTKRGDIVIEIKDERTSN